MERPHERGVMRLPGVALHHEVRGEGPVVLLIAGGAGDAGTCAPIAAPLARRYTVVGVRHDGAPRDRVGYVTDPAAFVAALDTALGAVVTG